MDKQEQSRLRWKAWVVNAKEQGLCTSCGGENNTLRVRCEACRAKRSRKVLWEKIFALYGHICACCGEAERTFLTIDHMNNDGYKDPKRRRLADFVKSKRPDLQILCMNCNWGRARNYNICPHKQPV